MKTDFSAVVQQIDALIRKDNLWFDFHVLSYDFKRLIVAGSVDLTYGHNLEVIFEGVFFVQGYFQEWHSDTSQPVFLLPENDHEISNRFELNDCPIFVFRTDDYRNDVIIAAASVTFGTDTVLYYDRPDLKPGQRIADFVKRK